jgi:mono/diheme cytochrome c family protein
VLSPLQINDLVALIASWRAGETVSADIPLATLATNALFAMRDFDQPDAIFFMNAALAVADAAQRAEIQAIITLVEENRLFEAEGRLAALLPPEEMGKALYSSNCASCHGEDGSGGVGPSLLGNAYVQLHDDEELIAFILAGRPGTAMNGFEGIIAPEELANLVALLRSWQE